MVFEGTPWNSSATSLIAAARAHCHLVMLDDFLNSRRSAAPSMDAASNRVLEQVGDLWAVDTLCQGMGDVLACGILEIKEVWCPDCPDCPDLLPGQLCAVYVAGPAGVTGHSYSYRVRVILCDRIQPLGCGPQNSSNLAVQASAYMRTCLCRPTLFSSSGGSCCVSCGQTPYRSSTHGPSQTTS